MFDVAKFLPMLDQFVTGLNVNDTLKMIKQNKDVMKHLFTMSEKFVPSVDYLLDHIHGEFSEDGSNKKTKEIDIFKHFTDYIEDIGFSGKDGLPHLWDVYMKVIQFTVSTWAYELLFHISSQLKLIHSSEDNSKFIVSLKRKPNGSCFCTSCTQVLPLSGNL